jgi:hypothetical protein
MTHHHAPTPPHYARRTPKKGMSHTQKAAFHAVPPPACCRAKFLDFGWRSTPAEGRARMRCLPRTDTRGDGTGRIVGTARRSPATDANPFRSPGRPGLLSLPAGATSSKKHARTGRAPGACHAVRDRERVSYLATCGCRACCRALHCMTYCNGSLGDEKGRDGKACSVVGSDTD